MMILTVMMMMKFFQDCSATCPQGMFISPSTQRCNGRTFVVNVDDSMRPFDPETECTPCAECSL